MIHAEKAAVLGAILLSQVVSHQVQCGSNPGGHEEIKDRQHGKGRSVFPQDASPIYRKDYRAY